MHIIRKVQNNDMMLNHEQYEIMYEEGKRSGIPEGAFRRWPYLIDSRIPDFNKSIIESAITRFNSEMSGCFSIV